MNLPKWSCFSAFALALGVSSCNQPNQAIDQQIASEQSDPVFRLIEPAASGMLFENRLAHDVATRANLFDFDYFYNGAGVGIADINNDGLPDVFLCGNQVENRLFLNKGNLQFEDITEKAQINTNKHWSNGVTFTDVNGDGWLDIYVSQGGPNDAEQRNNLLFINQQNLVFEEQADSYGLADTGFSTQSAFFDYDKDGDLDCVVMNENPLYGVDPLNFYKALAERPELLQRSSSHFYINEGSKFTNATAQVGMLRASFGLGLVVSDINNDGWLDVYMANDYFIPDAMFINQKNGSFSDEIKDRTKQVSFYGMGADIADINNDLHRDIFVLDMASADHYRAKTLMASMSVSNFNLLVDDFDFAHQYMFNSLQLNYANDNFANVAHQLGIAKTDWSWAGLVVDLNLDGWKDIYVTNGYRRYATDNDFRNMVTATQRVYQGKVPLDVKSKLYEQMPSEKLSNQLYANNGDLVFSEQSQSWGLDTLSYSNGAAYADLDDDGDLDLVVNNLDDNAFLFENLTADQHKANYLKVVADNGLDKSFAKVYITYNGQQQMVETKAVRGYFSYSEPVAHFGIGTNKLIDTVRVEWLDGSFEERYQVTANQEIVFEKADTANVIINDRQANPHQILTEVAVSTIGLTYQHVENDYDDFYKEVLLPYKQSTLGPMVAKGDMNGDGADDIYFGGAAGEPGRIYLQSGSGFKRIAEAAFEADAKYEDMEALVFDIDSDGDNDLYVVSGGNEFDAYSENYEDRIYINDGKGSFTRQANVFGKEIFESGKAIEKIDFDLDGDYDLIVGNRIVPHSYPRAAQSYIFRNDNGKLVDVTLEVAPELSQFGIINDVLVTDFDRDQKLDFIVVGEWTGIGLFRNSNGVFSNVADQHKLSDRYGWWFSITETDVNNDQLPDYVLGNVGLNTKFKASTEKPFKVFGGDFDENGSYDVVLSSKYKDQYVPVRGRECSSQQMPFIAQKFPNYDAFATASIDDILENKMDSTLSLEATEFRSLLLINTGTGFTAQPLPNMAQTFPLLTAVSGDLNSDGFDDLILAGTIYDTEVETPRWDAGQGLVLIADRQGGYQSLDAAESGLYINGDVKELALVSVIGNGKNYLVAAKNDDSISLYEIKNSEQNTNTRPPQTDSGK